MGFNITRNTHTPTADTMGSRPDPQAIINNSSYSSPPAEIHITPDRGNTGGNVHNNNNMGGNTGPQLGAKNQPHHTSHSTMMGFDTGYAAEGRQGFPRTIVTLSPIATPQALGLTAWASATFIFASYIAEWYGSTATAYTVWPFLLAFGGLGQFAAGMWSFRARDTINSALHTMWGCFWIAMGLYFAVQTASPIDVWSRIDAFAIWQVPIAAFTWTACIASLFRDWSVMAILFAMATGSTLSVIGWFTTSETVLKIAAYFWIVSSIGMWYRVTAHFLSETSKKDSLLPLYRRPNRFRGRNNAADSDGCDHQWVAPYREAGVIQGEW